jgi:hypothetical protein
MMDDDDDDDDGDDDDGRQKIELREDSITLDQVSMIPGLLALSRL